MIETELRAPTQLFWETSDDYFSSRDPLQPFDGQPISLGFIDGKHLIEFALRDFINVERHSDWGGVIVVVLPRSQGEGARQRESDQWAGDVYKITSILARFRPDLICLKVRTRPTGLLLVLGLDPANMTLADNYDRIIEEVVGPDRETVPPSVLRRRDSLSSSAVLSASFWDTLRDGRASGIGREEGQHSLRAALREDFGADRPETG